MRIPPERLIDGCIETLRRRVLPELGDRATRGQLLAVLDVLQNLRDRVEERRAPMETESDSLAATLARLADALAAGGSADAAARVTAAVAAAPPAPPPARRESLRDAFRTALGELDGLPEPEAVALRAVLGGHLAAQALRDLAPLKPSLLEEISRGG